MDVFCRMREREGKHRMFRSMGCLVFIFGVKELQKSFKNILFVPGEVEGKSIWYDRNSIRRLFLETVSLEAKEKKMFSNNCSGKQRAD